MDTSKEYIEMCSLAHEIQEWKKAHSFGDVLYHDGFVWYVNGYELSEGGNSFRAVRIVDDTFLEKWFSEDDLRLMPTWLPRADQLPIMMNTADTPRRWAMFQSGHFMEEVKRLAEFATWEQVWLAFVMREKFGKIWNGTWTAV